MFRIIKPHAKRVKLFDVFTSKNIDTAIVVKRIGEKFLLDPDFWERNFFLIQVLTEDSWLEVKSKTIDIKIFSMLFPTLKNDGIRN